jgi:hypothetical protein
MVATLVESKHSYEHSYEMDWAKLCKLEHNLQLVKDSIWQSPLTILRRVVIVNLFTLNVCCWNHLLYPFFLLPICHASCIVWKSNPHFLVNEWEPFGLLLQSILPIPNFRSSVIVNSYKVVTFHCKCCNFHLNNLKICYFVFCHVMETWNSPMQKKGF